MVSQRTGLMLVVLSSAGCASEPPETPPAAVKQPIFNGDVLSTEDSRTSPAVSIRFRHGVPGAEFLSVSVGSGILIAPDVVLTAAHVVACKPEDHVSFGIEVQHRNNAEADLATVVGLPIVPKGFRCSNISEGVDLAVLKLSKKFTSAVIPGLDCNPLAGTFRPVCTSGGFTDIDAKGDPVLPFGDKNSATLHARVGDVRRMKSKPFWLMEIGPNDFFSLPFTDDQSVMHGDSGMGCVELDNRVQAINSEAVDALPGPGNEWGDAVRVETMCGFIQAAMKPATVAAAQIDIDLDGEEDFLSLARLEGDTFTLTVDRSALSDQSFTLTLPGLSELESLTLGTFGGGKAAMAFTDGGVLQTASLAGGPAPAVLGAPSEDYVQVATARLNGDALDDLVAYRSGGALDAFVAGATGLQFSDSIDPISMRLDRDTIPDFVWIDGGNVNVSSSRGGRSRLTLTDNLVMDVAKPGIFRLHEGDHAGVHDLAMVGDGTVVWCESTLFGLECPNVLDAPHMGGRIAENIEVDDLNADGLHDIKVTYSNSSPRFFIAQEDGFATNFGYRTHVVAPINLDGDTDMDTVTADPLNGNIALKVRLAPEGEGDFGPIDTGIPFVEPVTLLAANLNDDEVVQPETAASNIRFLTGRGFAVQDLAILSGGQLYALLSNGDGSFEVRELEEANEIVAVTASDVNGDGIDDLEAELSDGSITVFAGQPGSGGTGGPEPIGRNFTGFPTADGNDGRMLLVSGLGVDTVAATESRLRLTVGEDDLEALDGLTVQVFDGDQAGLHQFEEETNLLQTCYRLSADPCGDGNSGNCSGGPGTPVEIVTVSSDDLGDDRWDTIFDGPHSPAASLSGNGEPPFLYELRVFLSEDCSTLPTAGSALPVATADAFKVRSNALVSHALGEFSLVASDSSGDFGLGELSYMRDTAYDGTFTLPIAVGASAVEIQLKEADADDLTDATPGVSLGANAEIQYRLLNPSGTPMMVTGADDPGGAVLVSNPSGNNDGDVDLDVETRIHTITQAAPGTWLWQWENVTAANALHLFAPLGSPTTFEVLGARRPRPTFSTARQPHFWEENAAGLGESLPVVLGEESGGSLLGRSVKVATRSDALQVLANTAGSLEGELERQLLVAKLNSVRGSTLGEDLHGALVYGTTTSVRSVLRLADSAVAGLDPDQDEHLKGRLATLLSSINLGEITYQMPGVPFPDMPMADEDDDGIINLKDNCPNVANELQEDSDDDRIGDACSVVPVEACVLERADGSFSAHFGYDNPLSFRGIPIGSRNRVLVDGVTVTPRLQPTEFSGGTRGNAFSVAFAAGSRVNWEIDGQYVTASSESIRCSGRELTHVPFARGVALYGSEEVTISDHSSVGAREGMGTVLTGGTFTLGSKSVVGHVLSTGTASIGDDAEVRGAAISSDRVQPARDAVVRGSIVEGLRLPAHSLSWVVDFEAGDTPPVIIPARSSVSLSPGDYGAVSVEPGAQLWLEAGEYRFASLDVAGSGVLMVSSGLAVVHIAHALQHRGETRLLDSTAQLVVGYLGTADASVESSFSGELIAPRAKVTLGAIRNSVYSGAFFARAVDVRPGTIVEFVARR